LGVLSVYKDVIVSMSNLGMQGDTLEHCILHKFAVKYCQIKKYKFLEKRECKRMKTEIIENIIKLLYKCEDLSLLDFILQLLQKLA
jgi:hypothetical protein